MGYNKGDCILCYINKSGKNKKTKDLKFVCKNCIFDEENYLTYRISVYLGDLKEGECCFNCEKDNRECYNIPTCENNHNF